MNGERLMLATGSGLNGSGKITLDKVTFKVLASETRVGILKSLDKSQMTVSDLARAMDMSKATMFEHLEKLVKAGLIKKNEDERKWVYYKLTWKGKNILHPERTKIAIVLTIVIIAFVVVGAFYVYRTGFNLFEPSSERLDTEAPVIDFVVVEDITENTLTPASFTVEVEDNEGISESSLRISYTVHDTYTQEYYGLTGWQELPGELEGNLVVVQFPSLDWSLNAGKYLYIKCKVRDDSHNFAEEVYIEYIERIHPDTADLSITTPDVRITRDLRLVPQVGVQNIPLKMRIHNTGSLDLNNFELRIFNKNPDLNNDGLVDNYNNSKLTKTIGSLGAGKNLEIKLNLAVNLSESKYLWVVVDSANIINESDESNNIALVSLKPIPKEPAIPELPPVVIIIIMIVIFSVYMISRTNRDGPEPTK